MSIFKKIGQSLAENINVRYGIIPFYKMQGYIGDFLKRNQNEGIGNPTLLDVAISGEAEGYKLSIDAYYSINAIQEVDVKTAHVHFKDISDIPEKIERTIKTEGRIKVRINDILNFLLDIENDVAKAVHFSELQSIVYGLCKDVAEETIISKKLHITDKFFRKDVKIQIRTTAASYPQKISFRDILLVPSDVEKILIEKGEVELSV